MASLGAPTRSHTDDIPFSGRFLLKIDDQPVGSFMECSGLAVEMEIEEIKEGGQNEFVHKLPGRLKWPNLTFKRGVTKSDTLFKWINVAAGTAGKGDVVERCNGAVTLLDSKGDEVQTWSFRDAIPVKWKGPDLSASASDVAVEELEVAHHGFTMEAGGGA